MGQAPRRSSRVAYRSIDEEGIVVPIRRSVDEPLQVHALNPVAAFVWRSIDGQRSAEELARLVAEEFEVEAAQALSDVREFIEELARADLLEEARR